MIRRIFPSSRCVEPTTEFKPIDRMPSQRIRESVMSHIPLEQSGVPIFDDPVGQPSKSMDVPDESRLRDNLDKAQVVIDHFGAKVDAVRVAREASAKSEVKTETSEEA